MRGIELRRERMLDFVSEVQTPNFTVQDLCGSTVAVLAFALVLYVPGYLLGFGIDLFGFRRRGFPERTSWAIVLSFVSVPLAAYLVGKFGGLRLLCWLIASLAVAFCCLQISRREMPIALSQRTVRLAGIACAWTAFVLVSLVDVQVRHKLYFSVVEFDQSYRVAFTNAVLRTGVPPANPLYFAGRPAGLRYYYFWYVVCALPAKMAGVSATQAFIASSIWVGFGLVATLELFVKHFCGATAHVRRHVWIAVGLLTVTGADLVPAIGSLFAQPALNGEMEWWSIDQFYSWQDSILWVPHHTASLLCCLASFLFLWRTREQLASRQRVGCVVLAGVAFASAFGLSVYVAFAFFLVMLAWVALLMRGRLRDVRLLPRVAAAGLVSAVLLTPFVHELTASHSTVQDGQPAGAGQLFSLSVRRMIDPELVTHLPTFAAVEHAHPALLDTTVRLLLLLPGLGLELGAYGAVYVLLWMARRRSMRQSDAAQETAYYLAGCGLVIVLFVRSSVISNNDFAYRGSLLPQFFLLLLAADALASWWIAGRAPRMAKTRGSRATIYALLALGVAGTVYQAVMLRLFLPIAEREEGSGFSGLAAEMYQARAALSRLDPSIPQSAVVAFNPVDPRPSDRGDVVPPYTFFSRSLLMHAGRQILSAEPTCASEFGGDATPCAAIEDGLSRLYGAPAVSADSAREFCRQFGVSLLIASRADPAWGEGSKGWMFTLPAVSEERDIRVLRCSPDGK